MDNNIGQINIIFGWGWMIFGFILGMIVGLKFDKSDWLGGYISWERRMIRLSHVAFIMLSAINILYGHELPNTHLTETWQIIGSVLAIVGAVGIPVIVMIAAFYKKILFWLSIPVVSITIAGIIIFIGLI